MHRTHTTDNYSAVLQGFNDRLQAILPLIEEKAEEAETLGRMHDDVVDAMRKGLLHNAVSQGSRRRGIAPNRCHEINVRAFLCPRIIGLVHDGQQYGRHHHGDLPRRRGIANVFKDGVDVTIAGNGVPRGFARKVDGGYMIRGNWAYGSSIFHAEWIHSGCFLLDPKDPSGKALLKDETGAPQIIVAHHPRSTIQLLGNWDVLGLRATGSFDYTLATDEDLFVPDSMTYSFTQSAPKRGQTQGHLGLAGYSALTHTSWAIGVGRRILDELAKVIRQRQDPFGKSADSASLRFQFANAEARYRAARALAMETWEDVSQTTASGGVPSLDQMTMVKLSLRYMHDIVSDVATFAHRAARGASLHNTAMQRFYRDIHSGTQHILLADQIVEECGKGLLGLSGADARWTVFGISEN